MTVRIIFAVGRTMDKTKSGGGGKITSSWAGDHDQTVMLIIMVIMTFMMIIIVIMTLMLIIIVIMTLMMINQPICERMPGTLFSSPPIGFHPYFCPYLSPLVQGLNGLGDVKVLPDFHQRNTITIFNQQKDSVDFLSWQEALLKPVAPESHKTLVLFLIIQNVNTDDSSCNRDFQIYSQVCSALREALEEEHRKRMEEVKHISIYDISCCRRLYVNKYVQLYISIWWIMFKEATRKWIMHISISKIMF